MYGPTRFFYALRPRAPVALLAGTIAVAAMFAATPFLIPAISDRYGVSAGFAGAISVAQVGAFALVNFALPRRFTPTAAMFRWAAIALAVMSLASMVTVELWQLVLLRLVAGGAAGTLTWIAWVDAMSQPRSMAGIASVGPVTALVAAPILSLLAENGDRAVYLALGLVALPAIVLRLQVQGSPRPQREVSRSRSNRILLAALFVLTLAGSALFIHLAVVGTRIHDLDPVVASLAFSLNSVGGLIGARLAFRHRHPGWWLASAGPAVAIVVVGGSPGFFIGMAWWGFAFWMAVPGILQMLSERSLQPAERAGDAQGIMAVGRALGPIMGGIFADADRFTALAIVSASGIAAAGLVTTGVKEGRERLPPSDPRVIGPGPP